ncbi:MAG: di-trans,poly-cis-decaprenylcistransferase, partial [Clostridia bacterium]|nr:di-trans,poly-cis-decaprenylcistransferase [Clostridia bacterium]
SLRAIIRESSDLGIDTLSLFAFSTENWRRSEAEVSALMQLLLDYFTSEIDELDQNNVRIRILGGQDGLPGAQREAVRLAETRTKENTGLNLCIALNYGGRQEIVRAARRLAQRVEAGEISAGEVDEAAFERELYTAGLPDVDLLIRTSGEMRLSGFLLYQSAYAEFLFPKKLWPDFTLEDYHEALEAYARRDRRFGGRTA